MKLLITGGAGFMGSNFVRHILNRYEKYTVVNLDKLTYAGNLDNLRDVVEQHGDRYSFVQGDIVNPDDVRRAGRGCDAIVNFAAETHVDRSILEPEAFLKTDVLGTFQLLEYARAHSVSRYLQVSTDEVFGSVEDGEFTESSPFEPNSPYAASKAGGDLLCRAYNKTYNLGAIVTHSCNLYGPYQYPEKIIPLFITNIIEGKKVPVYGDGTQVREWIYTEDYCAALDLLLHQGVAGEVYNIGTGQRTQNLETTRQVLSLLGAGEEMIEFVTDRPGHDVRYAVNADKLSALGWKPTHQFAEGLKKTVEWYITNQSWWKRIKNGEYMAYYKKQYERR